MSHSNISVMQQSLFFLNKSKKVLMAFVNQLSTVGVIKIGKSFRNNIIKYTICNMKNTLGT